MGGLKKAELVLILFVIKISPPQQVIYITVLSFIITTTPSLSVDPLVSVNDKF